MSANDYQILAKRTLTQSPDFKITPEQVMLSWTVIGLTGEAGEVAELIKKGIYHQQGIDLQKMKSELGDVLWYLSGLAGQFGFTLEEIMTHNIEKNVARYPDGFLPERSTFREGAAR